MRKMRKAFGWGYFEVWKCGKWAPIDEKTVIDLGENLWRENRVNKVGLE